MFWETVPAQYLPLVLWLEADRMATLRIDEDTFKREREVVKEERRMRVENQPYGRLSEIIYDQAFTVHPYKHPTIGSMEDLEAASIEDVRDFYRTYYVPANATLTIVGDFDSDQALQLVQQYFGRVPKPPKPVPRDIPKEPPQTKEKRVTVEEPWPLPAVVVAYHITYDGHPDSYPLHMASKILSDGQSSRIYRKLVYEKRLALTAFGGGNIIEHPNLFYAVGDRAARADAGGRREGADRRVRSHDEPSRSASTSCSAPRTSSRATTSSAARSIQEKAAQLAHAAVIHNDITTADGEFDIFQNITAADIQRVAQDLLHADEPAGADTSCRRAADSMNDEGRTTSRTSRRASQRAPSRRLVVRSLGAAGARRRAQAPNWPTERPPRPLPARDVKFPPYEIRTLPTACRSSSSSTTSSRWSRCGCWSAPARRRTRRRSRASPC